METNVEIFQPGIGELKKVAERLKELAMRGVKTEEDYALVKAGQKEAAEIRIAITKFGKSKRDEAIAYQREVLRQERMHLDIIVPVEDILKSQRTGFEEAKKREERKVLLPARIAMLAEIGVVLSDEEILGKNEEEFALYYQNEKMAFYQRRDEVARAEKERKARELEIKEAEERAAAEATRRAEEKARLEKEAAERAEAERVRAEAEEKARVEKNRRYKLWLKENGYTEETKGEYHIARDGETFTLFRKVSSINIK